jgi:hypothetical protein
VGSDSNTSLLIFDPTGLFNVKFIRREIFLKVY